MIGSHIQQVLVMCVQHTEHVHEYNSGAVVSV